MKTRQRLLGCLVVSALVILVGGLALFLFRVPDVTDQLPPGISSLTVTLSAPSDDSKVPLNDFTNVSAEALGVKPITALELWIDGAPSGTQNAPAGSSLNQFTAFWTWTPVSEGEHALLLRAIDAGRNVGMSNIATAVPSPTPTALPPLGITFFADQTNLVLGQCTIIHWQVSNASQVLLDNAPVAASGSTQDCPRKTTTHSLRVVTLDNQTVERTVAITVVAPSPTPTPVPPTFTPTPTLTPTVASCRGTPVISFFDASPTTILLGGTVTLSWGLVTNADSVSIDPGIGGVGTPGSTKVKPSKTTTYTLSAFCGRNTARSWVTVTVVFPIRK